MRPNTILGIIAVVLFVSALCYYIGRRFLQWMRAWTTVRGIFYWPVFSVSCLLPIVSYLIRIPWLSSVLRSYAYLWMCVFFYAVLIVVLADAVRLLLYITRAVPRRVMNNAKTVLIGGIAVMALLVSVISYGFIHARDIQVTQYSVALGDKGESLKAVLLSDLHIGASIDVAHVGKIVQAVNAQDPDIIFISGDIFDGDLSVIEDPDGVRENLARLYAPNGVYACFGNHDGGRGFDTMAQWVREAGITLLLDQTATVAGIQIAGRKDRSPIGGGQGKRMELSRLAEKLDPALPMLLLDHQPQDTHIDEAEAAGFDLMLSGHTHKGQIFPVNLITDRIYRLDYGRMQTGGLTLIVTSGVGFWGPPMRIGTQSEIVVLDITW